MTIGLMLQGISPRPPNSMIMRSRSARQKNTTRPVERVANKVCSLADHQSPGAANCSGVRAAVPRKLAVRAFTLNTNCPPPAHLRDAAFAQRRVQDILGQTTGNSASLPLSLEEHRTPLATNVSPIFDLERVSPGAVNGGDDARLQSHDDVRSYGNYYLSAPVV